MQNKISDPILITGASGFIGANLTRHLIHNYNVHIFIRKNSDLWRIHDIFDHVRVHEVDLLESFSIQKVVNDIKPKTIFHLAAYGAYPFQNNFNRIKSVILDGTINLLQACIKHGFNIFINTGSNSEYGFKADPMKETDIICPNSNYAVFKAAATHYCQFIAESQNLPIITIRPFHIYGPFEEPLRLIPQLISKLLKNELPKLVHPDIARDMLYIDDAVNLFETIASEREHNGSIYNMGSGKQVTIKKIVETAIELMEATVIPQWGSMKPREWDQNTWVADMTMVKKKFNWYVKNDINDGIKKVISWYKKY